MSRFVNGHPGGPGRPRGSRNVANQYLDALAAEGAEKMVQAMVKAASEGDRVAARLVLNRIWSAPKGRAAAVELPAIRTPADLVTAHGLLAEAVSEGRLTAADAASLSSMLEAHRRSFELLQQEDRVAKLEAEIRDFRQKLAPMKVAAPLAGKAP